MLRWLAGSASVCNDAVTAARTPIPDVWRWQIFHTNSHFDIRYVPQESVKRTHAKKKPSPRGREIEIGDLPLTTQQSQITIVIKPFNSKNKIRQQFISTRGGAPHRNVTGIKMTILIMSLPLTFTKKQSRLSTYVRALSEQRDTERERERERPMFDTEQTEDGQNTIRILSTQSGKELD